MSRFVLTVPLFFFEMGAMAGLRIFASVPPRLNLLLQLLLATPVVLWGGKPFFERAWRSLRDAPAQHVHADRVGTGAAYLYSLVATLAPGLYPRRVRPQPSRRPRAGVFRGRGT